MVNYKNGQAPYLNEDNLNLMQKIDTCTVTLSKDTNITNNYEVTFEKNYQVRK